MPVIEVEADPRTCTRYPWVRTHDRPAAGPSRRTRRCSPSGWPAMRRPSKSRRPASLTGQHGQRCGPHRKWLHGVRRRLPARAGHDCGPGGSGECRSRPVDAEADRDISARLAISAAALRAPAPGLCRRGGGHPLHRSISYGTGAGGLASARRSGEAGLRSLRHGRPDRLVRSGRPSQAIPTRPSRSRSRT